MYIVKRHEHDYAFYAQVACGPVIPLIGVAATLVSTGVGVMGAMQQAAGIKAQGRAAQQAAEYKAKQLEQQAQQTRAAAQRQALERTREGDLARSTLVARAAASGGGAADETVLGLGEQIAGRSEYERLMEMFKGEDAAIGMEDAAKASRAGGEAAVEGARYAARGARLSAIGTIADGASSMFSKYAGKLPSGDSVFGISSDYNRSRTGLY
jgi:hypothetical protein